MRKLVKSPSESVLSNPASLDGKVKSALPGQGELPAAAQEKDWRPLLAPKFTSPNRPKETPISDWFFGIQEKVFVDGDDPESVYDALEAKLKASDKLGHHNAALDEAEANWRLAHRLYMTAKVERMRWEQDNESVFASLWESANRELQTEKDLGNRSKQITDADIKARCAKLFPDEMRAQEVARARAKATEDTLAHLVEAWGQKCKSLNTIVGRGGR